MARWRGKHLATLAVFVVLAATGCKMNRYKSRWRTDVNAPLNARFVVAGEGAVIPRFGPTRAEGRLASFSLADGAERWERPVPEFILESAMGGLLLAVDPEGDIVYLVQDSTVAAHAASDGTRRWLVDVRHPTSAFEKFTMVQAPASAGDRILLLSRHSRIAALDRRDGKLLWRTEGGGSNHAFILAVAGGVVVTLSHEERDVRGHDLTTGEQLWARPMSGPFVATERLSSSIVLAARRPYDGRGLFYVVDASRALLALDVRSGAVKWEQPVIGLTSFAFAGSLLVVTDGASVRGVDPASGQVHWRQPTGGLSLVAPLDATTALLHLARSTCTVNGASGAIREHAKHVLHEQDHVLDAASGVVAMTTDNGTARLFSRDGERLTETTIGETAPRPGNPFAHGLQQAVIAGDGLVIFNTAHELERFVR